jgi:hypothetical protein
LLRDVSLDTNVVTQNKLRTATLILTFFFSLFLSFVLSFVSATRAFFFNKIFLNSKNFFCFFPFVLSSSLFFQQQHKDLVHKTLEQIVAQIYGIFRLAQAQIWAKVLGGSGDDQL